MSRPLVHLLFMLRRVLVYEWQNGQWLIAHHHSSAMPEVIARNK
ncbi:MULTISPECIES: hypothetical protein [unclassified Variovorax]|nr:hypothetical protein SAMN05444679_10244 [Variovorax sp. CF079]